MCGLESILGGGGEGDGGGGVHCVLMRRVWDGFIDSAPLTPREETEAQPKAPCSPLLLTARCTECIEEPPLHRSITDSIRANALFTHVEKAFIVGTGLQ